MKVIHLVSGGDTGGARTHIHSLLRGLNQSIQADLVCFLDGSFAQDAAALGIHVDVLPHRNIISALVKLKKMIRREQYDVIHCHGSRGNFMGACLRVLTGLPVVTTVHSDPKLDYLGRPGAHAIYGSVNHLALRSIPYHIGVSNAMTDLLIDRGIARTGFYTLYNGVSFDHPPAEHSKKDCLAHLGVHLPDNAVTVGIAARLDPVKDISTLIRGFADAHRLCPQLHLIIAGDGREHSRLLSLSKELGISQNVTFAGWVCDMDRFYGALDINVLTSLSETFPYALTEGARYRLATVATQVGGIPDLIKDSVNGHLFTPGDWQALSSRLVALGRDPELRSVLGNNLYQTAFESFSLETTVEQQLSVYQDILRKDAARNGRCRDGIVLCGAYGQGNAGDDAILQAIIREFQAADSSASICVMTRQPKAARKTHRVDAVFTFNYFGFRRKMHQSKLYINGGGSLIQNVTSRRSLWFYLSTLITARKAGCKVMMYGCGIGPVQHQFDRDHAAQIINRNVDVITLREPLSMDELSALGVTAPKIVLAADPTVSLTFNRTSALPILESFGLEPLSGQRYLGVTVRLWPGFEEKSAEIAAAVEYASRSYNLIPIFIPINPTSDLTAANHVAIHLSSTPHVILTGPYRTEETMALFSHMDMVLSMRLHGLIFSAVSAVPSVGIVYDPKVNSFLDSLGHPFYVPLEATTADKLQEQIDLAAKMLQNRSELRIRSDRLIQLETNNINCAKELLSS